MNATTTEATPSPQALPSYLAKPDVDGIGCRVRQYTGTDPRLELDDLRELLTGDVPAGLGVGWLVTKDNVTTAEDHAEWAASGGKEGLRSRKGWTGPRNTKFTAEQIREHGCKWRCLDDDGEVYYYGRIVWSPDYEPGAVASEEGFEPLDHLARPDAGATTIEYQVRHPETGKLAWVSL